jgi:predicted 2-oxoglutarate/Fe(II)-dependent dioxygenase YbiX
MEQNNGRSQLIETSQRFYFSMMILRDFIFPSYRIRIRPEPGLLVAFPSTHHYLHGVEPVTSGERVVSVCWMRVQGVPTKEEQDKEIADKYGIEVY